MWHGDQGKVGGDQGKVGAAPVGFGAHATVPIQHKARTHMLWPVSGCNGAPLVRFVRSHFNPDAVLWILSFLVSCM